MEQPKNGENGPSSWNAGKVAFPLGFATSLLTNWRPMNLLVALEGL